MDHLSDNYFVEKVVVQEDEIDTPRVSPQFYEEIERHQHPSNNFALIKINQTRLLVSRSSTQDTMTTLYLPSKTEIENIQPNSTVCAFVPSNSSPIHDLFHATDKYAQLYLDT